MARYGKSYLFENTTSDNRSRARKYMRDNSEMSKEESMQLDQELRVRFDNANKCECKFLLGLARMYMNGELEDNNTAQAVNQALGIATEEPYASKLNQDLNGMTAMQFIDTFKDEVEVAGNKDKENLSKQDFGGNNGYDIVLIDSFDKARQYAQYTTWCVTQSEEAFENYTKGGVFYFCLKNGFENVPKEVGANTPLDEYGLSMIAVSIYPDGKCNTITCRWNHDNGGNDNVITTEELSKVIGENFYDVFKPLRTTITLGGKEYVNGITEDWYKALYDEQGNNVLGDNVKEYKVAEALSKILKSDILWVRSEKGYNYVLFKDDVVKPLFTEWFSWCWYDGNLSNILGVLCFSVRKNGAENYLIYQDGDIKYLFDGRFDECDFDGELSKQLGVPCFRVGNDGEDNYLIYQDGLIKPLFSEWFDWCLYEGDLSNKLGVLCFSVRKNRVENCLIYQDGDIKYLFDEWLVKCQYNKNLSDQVGLLCFGVKNDDGKVNIATYNGGRAQYLLDDWVDLFGRDDDLSSLFDVTTFIVRNNGKQNCVIIKSGKAKYLLKDWVDKISYREDLNKLLGAPCFFIENTGKENYATYRDGQLRYLFDGWFDMCKWDENLTIKLGVPCFQIGNNEKYNCALFQDGQIHYLFDQWFDRFAFNDILSNKLGVLCFCVANSRTYNVITYKDGQTQYLFDEWLDYNGLRDFLQNYINQRNERRIRQLTNFITEMVIRKLK